MNLRKKVLRDERGASAVEFAVIAATLITILVGITQFGVLFFQWLEIVHAAREGARWASLENVGGSIMIEGTTRYKVYRAAPGLSPRLADANIIVDPENTTDDDAKRNPVTVTVWYDTPVFTPVMRGVLGTGGPTFRLQSSATQMVE